MVRRRAKREPRLIDAISVRLGEKIKKFLHFLIDPEYAHGYAGTHFQAFS